MRGPILSLVVLFGLAAKPAEGHFANNDTLGGHMPARQGSERAFRPGCWRIDPAHDLLTIVVPVLSHPEELAKFEIQLRSLAEFFHGSSVKEMLLIVPAFGMTILEEFLQRHVIGHLHNLPMFTVVSDETTAPDLRGVKLQVDEQAEHDLPGYIRQQVLKLAISALIQTPFFLVLDTDIQFAHPFSAQDLFRTGVCSKTSPVCSLDGSIAFYAKTDVYDLKARTGDEQAWRASTASFLQLELPRNWLFAIGSTPQIFATDLARQLGPWLQQRFGVTRWQNFLLEGRTGMSRAERSWRMPWTEFNLYGLYSNHQAAWALYHSHGRLLQDRRIMSQADFEHWQPCIETFGGTFRRGRGFFSTVASQSKVSAAEVWDKVGPCFNHSHAAGQPPLAGVASY